MRRPLLICSLLLPLSLPPCFAQQASGPSPLDTARALRAAGDTAGARAALEALVAKHVEQERARASAALLELGDLEEQQGRAARARRAWRRLLSLFPERRADANAAEARLRDSLDHGGRQLQKVLRGARIARGGERLSRLVSARARAELSIGSQTIPLTRALLLKELKIREDAPKLGLSKGWDGQQGWLRKGEVVSVLRGPPLDRAVGWAREQAELILGASGGELSLLGSGQVAGRASWRLRRQLGEQSSIEDLDRETLLPLRIERDQLDARGEVRRLALYYSDWQRVEGVALPGRIEVYRGDVLDYAIRFQSWELDPQLPATLFSPPTSDGDR
jgi:hypothetical protein